MLAAPCATRDPAPRMRARIHGRPIPAASSARFSSVNPRSSQARVFVSPVLTGSQGVRMKLAPVAWLWVALVAPPAKADVSVFRGPVGGRGNVEVRDERGEAPPRYPESLQRIELLPIDFAGRSQLDELLEGVPRLRTDIPGASRVLLPNGGGSLYRYRRDDRPGHPAALGLFLVDRNGEARSLWEIPGIGSSMRREPFLECVAVSSQGEAVLVATVPEAGGDLIEIDLASGKTQVRTADLPPMRFLGLSLLRGFGIGLSSQGPIRFERVNGAQASAVPFPENSPTWFGADVVKSAGEKAVAFVAGRNPDRALVFVCAAAGSAIQASLEPARLSGAGFLPERSTGPLLALSTDASWVAWCTEDEYSRECWLGRVGAPAGAPAYQVTQDANFEDTLNDTGVISFVSPDSFCVLVGETENGHGPLGEADLFRVDAAASGPPLITNLTLTSGLAVPPHSYGTLRAGDGISLLPGRSGVLLRARDENDEQSLVRIDVPSGKSELLLDRIDLVDFVEVAGDRALVSMRRSLPPQPRVLMQIPFDGARPATSLTLPEACEFGRQAVLRREGVLGAVLEIEGQEWLKRTSVSCSGAFLTEMPLTYGPTITFAPDGSLVASILAGETWFLVRWSPGSDPELLRAGISEGFLLPD